MAGKTLTGIGDLDDKSAPLGPADAADSDASDSKSFYSGPTVVDEAKVEQGLKKLRSLDVPPGPLTGITEAVIEVLESGPERATPQVPVDPANLIRQFTVDPARGTAVGRSVTGPVAGQQVAPPMDDRAMRGTMFGHMVHRPDFEPPDRKKQEADTSRALAVVDRGAPTSTEVAVYHPGTHRPPAEAVPLSADPYPRSNRFHTTPIAMRSAASRKKLLVRVTIAAAGIVAVVGAALIWLHSNGDEADSSARPAATAPVAAPTPAPSGPTPPLGAPTPAAAPTAATPAAIGPTSAAPTAAPEVEPAPPKLGLPKAPKAPAEPAAEDPEALAAPPSIAPTHHVRPGTTRADRRHAAPKGGEESDKTAAPAKPSRKRAVEEDPDATMAPTIE